MAAQDLRGMALVVMVAAAAVRALWVKRAPTVKRELEEMAPSLASEQAPTPLMQAVAVAAAFPAQMLPGALEEVDKEKPKREPQHLMEVRALQTLAAVVAAGRRVPPLVALAVQAS